MSCGTTVKSVRCSVMVDGTLPQGLGLTKGGLRSAAAFFAEKSSSRIGVPFRAVTVILQENRDRTKRNADPRTAPLREECGGGLETALRQPQSARQNTVDSNDASGCHLSLPGASAMTTTTLVSVSLPV